MPKTKKGVPSLALILTVAEWRLAAALYVRSYVSRTGKATYRPHAGYEPVLHRTCDREAMGQLWSIFGVPAGPWTDNPDYYQTFVEHLKQMIEADRGQA